jgi:hypothetical protein
MSRFSAEERVGNLQISRAKNCSFSDAYFWKDEGPMETGGAGS